MKPIFFWRDEESAMESAFTNYMDVRRRTETICAPLEIEDYVIQGMDDVSPAKWHLAHTTWFFETLVLVPQLKNYKVFNDEFHLLFNSYYQSLGRPLPRGQRGLLSRPTVKMIYDYRLYVDTAMQNFLQQCSVHAFEKARAILTIGLEHEQQHQELLLMDIKFNYSLNPSFPTYCESSVLANREITMSAESYLPLTEGIVEIGYTGDEFRYDNETPRHQQFLDACGIANRLVTNIEYLEFMLDGGYQKPEFWLADGWDWVTKNNVQAPLYWYQLEQQWHIFTLHGLVYLMPNEPVTHISFYEADAFARWRGKRLPTEIEWEHFVNQMHLTPNDGNFLEKNHLHPLPGSTQIEHPQQFFGDVWEWTMSPYVPYPGYRSYLGPLGEYNGKFMCNQHVLRGGCCITPLAHIRASYRNFFQAEKRWQFSGIRLAEDHF